MHTNIIILTIAIILLIVVYFSTSYKKEDEEVSENDEVYRFLDSSVEYSGPTITVYQLNDFRNKGLILMRRLPKHKSPYLMAYTPYRSRRWLHQNTYFYYLNRYPSWYYQILHPYYNRYINQYCWVRGYDGDWYALRYVDGRCPLDLLK